MSAFQKLKKLVWKAQEEFELFKNGDKIMVCLSGGKDSYAMLDLVLEVHKSHLLDFEIVAVNLDQKQPNFPEHILPEYLKQKEVPFKILEKDTYSVVMDKVPEGKTMCSLCSRLRRGTLYQAAKEMGCNKIALGHHADDVLETFLLNLFFSGKLETMPAKYTTDDGTLEVIRPMVFCKETAIEKHSEDTSYPIIPCNLCGNQEGLQRQSMKKMLSEWETKFPDRKSIMLNALQNVSPSHLLDKELLQIASSTAQIS